jgi:uncharacterized membrane protein YjfL (UPF0719 family)
MEYYSSIKKNKMSFAGKWIGVEITMFSEIIRKTNIMLFLIYGVST